MAGYDPHSRREALELAHMVRARIGTLMKVVPTSLVAACLRRSMSRADLVARVGGLIETLAGMGANLDETDAAAAVDSAVRLFAARGIIVDEQGTFRVRERVVLRYYARTIGPPAPRRPWQGALMVDAASKAIFHLLAGSRTLQRMASRYGLASPGGFARRFIAGETVEEAVAVARQVEAAGRAQTLDYLGESVGSLAEADQATRDYLAVISRIVEADVGRNISLKLTQLGLDLDRVTAVDNLRRILEPATAGGFFVRVDMENSPYAEITLDIFETLWGLGYRNLGVVLQSTLYRTDQDLERMLTLGARVRLVKGAYKEPASVAYQRKADVDAAYLRLMAPLLQRGVFPALATHDPAIIDAARTLSRPGRHREGPVRVPDAVRGAAGPAGVAFRRGIRRPGVHPLRPSVVPLLHAAPGRAPGQRGLRAAQPDARRLTPPPDPLPGQCTQSRQPSVWILFTFLHREPPGRILAFGQ